MKQRLGVALILLGAATALAADRGPVEVRGPSLANLFLTWHAASFVDVPYEAQYHIMVWDGHTYDDWIRGSDTQSAIGLGYTLLNLWERLIMDFEYDYSRLRFRRGDTSASVVVRSFGLSTSYWLDRRRAWALYCGMGMAGMDRTLDWTPAPSGGESHSEASEWPMWISLGVKRRLARHWVLRADVRFHALDRNRWDYWDEWYGGSDESDYFGTRFALGLEWWPKKR